MPERTCLGCRGPAEKRELLRVVVVAGVVQLDHRQRLPGRGGYLHRDAGCLRQAVKRRAFARALRQPGLDASGALAELERAVGP